eukprot:1141123-Pelagomonas_calceolata.AAC.1
MDRIFEQDSSCCCFSELLLHTLLLSQSVCNSHKSCKHTQIPGLVVCSLFASRCPHNSSAYSSLNRQHDVSSRAGVLTTPAHTPSWPGSRWPRSWSSFRCELQKPGAWTQSAG